MGDVASWATETWEGVKSAASSVGGWFASLFGWGSEDDSAATDAEAKSGEAGSTSKQALIDAFSGTDAEVAAIFQNMVTLSDASFQLLSMAAEAANTAITTSVATMSSGSMTAMGNFGTGVNALSTMFNTATTGISADTSSMQSGIGTSFGSVLTMGNGLADSISKNAQSMNSGMVSVTNAAKTMASGIKSALSSLPSSVKTTFSSLASSMTSSFSTASSKIISLVNSIKSSLNSIPRNITVKATATKAFSMGGAVNQRITAEIGEDGKEWIIPVTKPTRGKYLLQQAAKDLGMTVSSVRAAERMLGGNAAGNTTPVYVNPAQSGSNTTNNQTTNVSAPATINVYGSDPQATANNVARNQERLVLRNLKSALA